MPKPRKSIKVRIPEYVAPRLRWRQLIQQAVRTEQKKRGISNTAKDVIEVRVRLYLKSPQILMHDIDNRLKDILDALQGRVGGPKKIKPRNPIIPNDSQIWRVIAEKNRPPWQSHGLGHLELRVLRPK